MNEMIRSAAFRWALPAVGLLVHAVSVRADGVAAGQAVVADPPTTANALPLLAITAPAAGTTFQFGDTVDVVVALNSQVAGMRTVVIHDNGKPIGAAMPDGFVHGWRFPDGGMLNFQAQLMFSYIHRLEYFFFTGAFFGDRFIGKFSARAPGGIADGVGNLDFAFDPNGLLKVSTSGDLPLGTRYLAGGRSTDCTSYRFQWINPPAGAHSLQAVATVTDVASGQTRTLQSAPVALVVGGVAPVPEIAVEQPKGSGLADGKSKRGFGTVKVGKAGSAKTFTIRNSGTASLRRLAVIKNGAHADDFVITRPVLTTLAPGASTTFKVIFKPKAKGARAAALHIRSNDADENPFDIRVTGVGS